MQTAANTGSKSSGSKRADAGWQAASGFANLSPRVPLKLDHLLTLTTLSSLTMLAVLVQ